MKPEHPTVCVVGGGHSGATAAKYLLNAGLDCASFDSRRYPLGGPGSLASEYFDAFIERHRIAHLMHTGVGVDKAVRLPDGVWEVSLHDGSSHRFDSLVVSCKPELVAVIPRTPGDTDFLGRTIHVSSYEAPADYVGAKVLVVGFGRAAERLAATLSRYADRVLLSCDPRRKETVLAPMGGNVRAAAMLLHKESRRDALEGFVRGKLRVVGEPVAFEHHGARFCDGTVEPVDVIIYCTGYNPRFSFLDEGLQRAGGRAFSLYRRMFRPEIDNLLFVGPFLPEADNSHSVAMQAFLAAEYLTGEYALPDLFRMRLEEDSEWSASSARLFSGSAENVHGALASYTRQLNRELTQGRRRARRNARRSPVPALCGRIEGLQVVPASSGRVAGRVAADHVTPARGNGSLVAQRDQAVAPRQGDAAASL